MSNSKDIKIRAVLDSSGFDQQVKQMQDRITQITRQSGVMQTAQGQFGKGSGMSKLTQNMFGDFNKSSVGDLREQFNLNVRQMQAQSRDMKDKEREITKLAKLEEKMTDAQKERVKLAKEEINTIREKGRILIEENGKIGNAARGLGVQDLAGAGFKGTGTAPSNATQPGFFGRAKNGIANIMSQMGGGSILAGAGSLAGAVGGVGLAGMSMAGDYIDYQRTRDRSLAKNIGQSVQGANIGFDSIMQKKGFMNSFENPERQAAMAMAMSEREKRLTLDPLKAGGSAASSAIGYGAAGAAAGSFIPGVGTIVGGIGGALFGAGKSMMGGGARSGFAQMFDRDAYDASVNAETLGNFRSNLTSAKMANPEKFAAANMFSQKRGGLQGLQRQLNMGDNELMGDAFGTEKYNSANTTNQAWGTNYGDLDRQEKARIANQNVGKQEGFLTRSTRDSSGKFSFTEERIKNNINGILQSGGSSDFVTQQMGATMAAEYQRGGMTNAARQLGGISGTGNQDGGGTQETYKKFISEAMRIGLDSSELAKDTTTANEETRRAMEAISNVYTKSGGAEGAAAIMAQGMMGGAGAEIAGAQSAFNIRNQESGQGTGYRGALKYAFMNSEKGKKMFEGVDPKTVSNLASYNLENLDEDDILIQKAAQQQGISPGEMVEKVRTLQASGENYSDKADKSKKAAQEQYKKFLSDKGLKDGGDARSKFRKSKEGIDAIGGAFDDAAFERGDGFLQQSAQSKDSYVFGGMEISRGPGGTTPKLNTKGRGALDVGEGSEASDQATAMQVLVRELASLAKSSEENRTANVQTKLNTFNTSQALNTIMEFMKEGGTDPSGSALDQLRKALNTNQPSYGNKSDD